MPGTRSSARQAAMGNSKVQPAKDVSSSEAAGTKRKAGTTGGSQSKKGKKSSEGVENDQATLEETLVPAGATANNTQAEGVDAEKHKDEEKVEERAGPTSESQVNGGGDDESAPTKEGEGLHLTEHSQSHGIKQNENEDIDMKDEEDGEGAEAEAEAKAGSKNGLGEHKGEAVNAAKTEGAPANGEGEENKPNGFQKLMDQESKDKEEQMKTVATEGTGSKVSAAEDAVETSSKRENTTPSSILEKGIVYFFFRGRVGIEEPTKVADIARSFIILRPLPHGAKLGDGPIGDERKNRMLALPKKVLPKSPKDRFMVFVEKANVSFDEIKESLSSSDYTTQTAGARHTPAATPIGEGVYALTQTGRGTHLAYKLTIPAELEAVQKDVGLKQQGSYYTSAKNPESKGPANASLPQGPNYPKEIIDEFRGRGWMPLQPKLLDYENTQFLIIGHGENALEKATEPHRQEGDKAETATPLEEVEKLEHEDELRVQHLDGDDSIFVDLGLASQEYPKVQTTW